MSAHDSRSAFALALCAWIGFLVATYAFWGVSAVLGGMIGGLCALFGVYALWLVIGLVSQGAANQAKPGVGTAIALVAAFAKLPIFWVGWVASQSLGPFAPGGFLAAVVLVYSLAVVWAATRNRD